MTIPSDILVDPERAYACPRDVLRDTRFTPSQKHEILMHWYDAEKRLVESGDEGMPGNDQSKLAVIVDALKVLAPLK